MKPVLAPTVLGLLITALIAPVNSAPVERPNIVLIMVDDFGYECVGADGSADYRTPNIDRLAAEGMRFEHCHVQPLCTPTRVQLMTGLYNARNYAGFGVLPRRETTFANRFREAGYATGIAGKWQLGHELDSPRHFGFDESCLWQHTRRPPRYANPGLEFNGVPKDYAHGEYAPDLVNAWALDFIARHREGPFLLYYPMILTHAPFQPTPDSPDWDPKAKGEQVNRNTRHFAEMVTYTDKLVGRVVEALAQHGLREKTLLIFLGDNGTLGTITSRMRDGTTIQGGKAKSTAAGTHVPLIVNWPGVVPAGRVNEDLVNSTDFYPTLCEATGIPLPETPAMDGVSFWPQLQGKAGTPRELMYLWFSRNGGAKPTHEFAATKRFKLYRDGSFYDYLADPLEESPLNPATLRPEAKATWTKLSAELARMQDARPAFLTAEAGSETP
ncbi:MAG: sulfatase-like hydrolase/transferase [Verrucomicrobiales bacterium]|nr:sulfatase-like hydrolase/transferase [Verrucomicrobiales bacterium]